MTVYELFKKKKISFRQKISNPNCKHIEALINAYLQKAANEEKKFGRIDSW
jgi:hypothetical protein